MADDKIVRGADLTEIGADELFEFIGAFHKIEGRSQAFLEVRLDDGTVIDKVELIAEIDEDGEPFNYYLQLSGL